MFYWLCFYSCTVFFPFISLHSAPLTLQHSPPEFMSMRHTYKFFSISISYTIVNLSLSILYLPFMLLIPCTFSHIPCTPLPHRLPSMWSQFLWFCSCSSCLLSLFLFLGSVVDSCWVCCHFTVHSLDLLFLR